MDDDFKELMKKYSKEDDGKEINVNVLKKIAQQISSLCNRYGLSILDMVVMFESLAQTCFDNLMESLKNVKDNSDLYHYSMYKREIINDKVLFRTQLTKLLMNSIDKKVEFNLGSNLNIGCSLSKRFDVLKKYNFSCRYCGRKPPEVELELEHVIPKSKGGNDSIENLAPACRDCNRGKGSKSLDEVKNGEKKE